MSDDENTRTRTNVTRSLVFPLQQTTIMPCWRNFPSEILTLIYSFDDTFLTRLRQTVLVELDAHGFFKRMTYERTCTITNYWCHRSLPPRCVVQGRLFHHGMLASPRG